MDVAAVHQPLLTLVHVKLPFSFLAGQGVQSNGSFFELWLNASMESQRQLIADQKSLIFDVAAVNVRYYRPANAVFIPAAVLQPDLHFANGPPSARYGSIGQVSADTAITFFRYDSSSEIFITRPS